MKGLKKLTLATAIAAVPFAANADLKALDDSAMGNVTGQSGVTIELEADVSIGEVAYQDDGFLAISDLTIGGAANSDGSGGTSGSLDDIKLYIDVAGTGGVADTGAQAMGNTYLEDNAGAAWSNTGDTSAAEAGMPDVEDGDLVIGIRSVSGTPVDFGVNIGSVSLAKSTATVGELDNERRANGGTSTTLVSNLDMTGLLGPVDIVIQEDTDVMNVGAYFNAQGTLNADFVGTYLDFELHNRRGEDTNGLVLVDASGNPVGETSFAYAQVDIGKGQNAAGEDALAFNVNNFSGDLDLTNIRMGSDSAPSIGDLYMTDLNVNAQMTVYGH